MIVINARIEATPETVEALTDAILTMEKATMTEEGCEDYTFSVELANPGVIRITERWQSEDALKAHFQTPHMAAFQRAMAEHPPAPALARMRPHAICRSVAADARRLRRAAGDSLQPRQRATFPMITSLRSTGTS